MGLVGALHLNICFQFWFVFCALAVFGSVGNLGKEISFGEQIGMVLNAENDFGVARVEALYCNLKSFFHFVWSCKNVGY